MSLIEKRLEEWDKIYKGKMLCVGDEDGGYDAKVYVRDFLKESMEMVEKEIECPPHNFIPNKYEGVWAASTPAPNMKCTKCLLTQYF